MIALHYVTHTRQIHRSNRRVVPDDPLASVLVSHFAEAEPSGTHESGDGAFC